jgi:hypothetical protein
MCVKKKRPQKRDLSFTIPISKRGFIPIKKKNGLKNPKNPKPKHYGAVTLGGEG